MFLLDTGIVLGFQKSGKLDALRVAAEKVPIGIVEEVYDEIANPRGGGYREEAARARAVIAASRIEIRAIPLGSSAAAALETLRVGKESDTTDLGEAASIAVALGDPAISFVTNDGAACLRGLQELRGRTVSFHPFLALLVETGGTSATTAGAIATAIKSIKDWHATHPLWWDAWLAGR